MTTYAWDGENRLAAVTLPGGSVTTFTYAANGLRRKTLVGGATKIFVWDHQNVLLETGSTGTTNAAYTQTPDGYGALVAQRRSGASIFYHFDALGSMTELTNSAQTVTDTWRYYAFGETKYSTGSTPNPFQFVGRLGYYTETALGLQDLRARWYNPAAGRFLSTDPIGAASRYGYVGDRALRAVDPSGLLPCEYQRAHGVSGVPCNGIPVGGSGGSPGGIPTRNDTHCQNLLKTLNASMAALAANVTVSTCGAANEALYVYLYECYSGSRPYRPILDIVPLPYWWPAFPYAPRRPAPSPDPIANWGPYSRWLKVCHFTPRWVPPPDRRSPWQRAWDRQPYHRDPPPEGSQRGFGPQDPVGPGLPTQAPPGMNGPGNMPGIPGVDPGPDPWGPLRTQWADWQDSLPSSVFGE